MKIENIAIINNYYQIGNTHNNNTNNNNTQMIQPASHKL
jgi:hypothetical protein